MTPKEAVHCANTGGSQQRVQEFIVTASPGELEEFCHYLEAGAHSRYFHLARIALDIRLAEDAERTAHKLVTGTDRLVAQTETLVKLTHRLYILTIVLIGLGSFEVFKFLLGLFCHNVQ